MCGRYQLDPEESSEIMAIIQQVENRVKTGEIYPTNAVPVLMEAADGIAPEVAVWGYPRFPGKSGKIINARGETAQERPMFRKSLVERRCVIPTTGFFEWGPPDNRKKVKYRFRLKDKPALYLAGLWNEFGGEKRCVILTTEANQSMAGIHDRMPVILHDTQLKQWVMDTTFALELVKRPPPALEHERAL